MANKAQTESENMEKSLLDVKRNNNDTKTKFEDLLKINNELKNRLVDYENTTKLHQDDLKNILKRNSNLQKNLEVKINLFFIIIFYLFSYQSINIYFCF